MQFLKIFLTGIGCALLGYLLGSISFAVIVSRVGFGQDVREHGSHSAGMTNVLRVYGKKAAVFTLLGDFSKGIAAVLLARVLCGVLSVTAFDGAYIAGLGAILGHLYPLYFHFRGGKGILTAIGIIAVIDPVVFVGLIAVCVPIMFITKIVSIGSLTGAVLFPIFTVVAGYFRGGVQIWNVWYSLLIAVLVVWMHRANIKRLKNGTENKFGSKKNEEAH